MPGSVLDVEAEGQTRQADRVFCGIRILMEDRP